MPAWDVIVVGAGPAGLAAARTAAGAGSRVLVLERAEHPRYKTCGGGLIGLSRAAVAGIDIAVRDDVVHATFTHNGSRSFTRTAPESARPLVSMVARAEFDHALAVAAQEAGAVLREHAVVRALRSEPASVRAGQLAEPASVRAGQLAEPASVRAGQLAEPDRVVVRLLSGEEVIGRTVIGADGSAGICAGHVGVVFDQVDLGLELEIPVDADRRGEWHNRLLVDWGPIPGSYGWVFPKGDLLTVGVIAGRGHGEATRRYLRDFVAGLGLAGLPPLQDSGHLTRCRADGSPLRRGRVIVAGDAAGLLEPWTREGISFALRSGAMAGAAAAADELDGYVDSVESTLAPAMRAGRRLLGAFARHPALMHRLLATPPGWRLFTRFCREDAVLERVVDRLPVRLGLALLSTKAPSI